MDNFSTNACQFFFRSEEHARFFLFDEKNIWQQLNFLTYTGFFFPLWYVSGRKKIVNFVIIHFFEKIRFTRRTYIFRRTPEITFFLFSLCEVNEKNICKFTANKKGAPIFKKWICMRGIIGKKKKYPGLARCTARARAARSGVSEESREACQPAKYYGNLFVREGTRVMDSRAARARGITVGGAGI